MSKGIKATRKMVQKVNKYINSKVLKVILEVGFEGGERWHSVRVGRGSSRHRGIQEEEL